MAYRLDYLTCLKTWVVVPVNIPIIAIITIAIIGPPLAILAWWIYEAKKGGPRQPFHYWWLPFLVVGVPIVAWLALSWSEVGSGYELEDNLLKLKPPPVSTTIKLQTTEVVLVKASGPWQPTLRINGYGTPGLSTGWFKLRNGKKAVVFRHLSPSKMVVLKSEGRYYVLAHPGVEKLYTELLRYGARENSF